MLVPEAILIALREGLEALLITGILLGLVTRLGRPDARKHVWVGFASAILSSLAAGWIIHRYLIQAFEERGWGAAFELAAAVLAIATLLYMVFWMWTHTTQVLSDAKKRVQTALTTGSLVTIVFITYISTLREGLETVLFYSALTAQNAMVDILTSGALGFIASAILVYAILRSSRKVSVKAFFTATGLWLLLVAGMLSTHAIAAATELGLLAPAPAIWDTSHIIAPDAALGRILHATVGYIAAPTLLQALSHLGIVLGGGALYLYRQGLLTQNTGTGVAPRTRRVAVLAATALLASTFVTAAALDPTDRMITGHHSAEDAEGAPSTFETDAHVGVLLRSHGEPVHYNATTYESFKSFYEALLESLGFQDLLLVDHGTILLDQGQPFSEDPRLDPDLIDAWLAPHDEPAMWTGSPVEEEEVPIFEGFYQTPGGPGLGEPDVLEALGLSTYQAYLQMENQSPMHPDKQRLLDRTEEILHERIHAPLAVERAHHIQPMIDPDNESLDKAVERLVASDVDVIVDAYTSSLHSDIMNTCMKQEAFHAALEDNGFQGTVLQAGPYGLQEAFAQGMAERIAQRVNAYPPQAHVWVSLTHHGMNPDAESPCKDRPDPYNEQTRLMFEKTLQALDAHTLVPNTTIERVYGQGAGDDDSVLSPMQAIQEARSVEATHLLDVPYELPGNGFDNLVQHRSNYGLEPQNAPHYDASYETHLTRHGIDITITRSDTTHEARANAQAGTILEALDEWQPTGGTP